MTARIPPNSKPLAFGSLAAVCGGVGLAVTVGGCLMSMPYAGAPLAAVAIALAAADVQRIRDGSDGELALSSLGLVTATVTLAINLLMGVGVALVVVVYCLGAFGLWITL